MTLETLSAERTGMASPATYLGWALCTPTTPAFIVDAPLSSMITVEGFMVLRLRLSRRGGAPGAASRVPCYMELVSQARGRTAVLSLVDGGGHQGQRRPSVFGHLPQSTASVAQAEHRRPPFSQPRPHVVHTRRISGLVSQFISRSSVLDKSDLPCSGGPPVLLISSHGDTRIPIDYKQPSRLKHTRIEYFDTRRTVSE